MQPIDLYSGSIVLLIAFGGLMLIVAIACFVFSSAKDDPDLKDLAKDVAGPVKGDLAIKTMDEYHKALRQLEELLEKPIPEFSIEQKQLAKLAADIEAFEDKHFTWFNH